MKIGGQELSSKFVIVVILNNVL